MAFAVFTVVWLFAIAVVRSYWNAPSTFQSFSPQAVPIQRNFRRQGPAAVVGGFFFITLGWSIILFHNAAWEVVPALLLTLLTLVSFGVVGSVWLFNRPRRLVPPNLRDLPGIWSKPQS